MSTISAVGSGANAWAEHAAMRAGGAAAMKEKLFAKVDSDGSGTVSKAELQGMLEHVAKKTGVSTGSADDVMKTMDSDGDGSLSADELDAGMRSLVQPPSSTVDFAQRHHGGPDGIGAAADMPPPPPPMDDGGTGDSSAVSASASVSGTGSTSSSSATSTTASAATDPLDTNGDGVVSAQERAAGALADTLKTWLQSADGNGDGSISPTEADSARASLEAALRKMVESEYSRTAANHAAPISTVSENV